MQYGLVFGFEDIHQGVALAQLAEERGWDGFFVADGIWGLDAWVTLAAIASHSQRLKLGTLLSPLSRQKPWEFATSSATLDRLSNGRLIIGTGLGALDTGFANYGEVTDRRQRAELLDEGLEVLTGLWQGKAGYQYQGRHYQITPLPFPHLKPVQQPRIPIWVVGAWKWPKSLARALRWDGILLAHLSQDRQYLPPTPDLVRDFARYAAEHRQSDSPYDIVIEGTTPANDPQAAREQVQPFAEAGASWWIESMWDVPSLADVRRRIEQGPPR